MQKERAAGEPLEIERKFLIRPPALERLKRESTACLEMCQVYLLRQEEGTTRRVRRSVQDGRARWYYTEKHRLSSMTRVEREREIGEGEYLALLKQADPRRKPVEKQRWCVPWDGRVLEIDLFPFWKDRAFCEVELAREEETVNLPPWLEVIREVTDDPRYTNASLALYLACGTLPEEDG